MIPSSCSPVGGVSGVTSFDRVTCCPLFRFHSFQAQVIREATDFDPVEQGVPPEYQHMDRIQRAASGHVTVKEGAL
jgi:hypothetical protein